MITEFLEDIIDIDLIYPTEKEIKKLLKKIENGKELSSENKITLQKIAFLERLAKHRGERV